LIISGLATKDLDRKDAMIILRREALTGLLLGSFLGTIGYIASMLLGQTYFTALVIPITILSVVTVGTSLGSMLPLILQRLGFDPALMSNPLIAGISDILGIVIYLNVAVLILG